MDEVITWSRLLLESGIYSAVGVRNLFRCLRKQGWAKGEDA